MQSQTPNEENQERNQEIDNDYTKARNFPETIIGRKRLRGLRFALFNMGINVRIPMNSAAYTDIYCKEHAAVKEADCHLNRREL